MIVVKYIMIFFVFAICFAIGNLISKNYTLRLRELKEIKNALNILESKIKFTYEPLPEIFAEISNMTSENISQIFKKSSIYMCEMNAEKAWTRSIENSNINLTKEDKENIKSFGKMLGKTDKEGQISQLELTQSFVEIQIEKAKNEEEKNAKMYKTLGTIVGLAFVIMLV